MIGIIDYGRGNLRSVEKALWKLGYPAKVLESPAELMAVKGIILPGVGAFADAMAALEEKGWIQPLIHYAHSGKPFLGICLGMQVLFEVGEEHGEHKGLGLLPGRVVRFPAGRKIPHMGWNTLHQEKPCRLLEGIPDEAYFYFVHSYYVASEEQEILAGMSDYGVPFPALVGRDNVWGAQFHPEKSSPWGLKLLENFGKWVNEDATVSSHRS
ncbi:imidazole glycerol phosphate synthase, glutamine amidotransferase subunit [Desulfitobacterium hafniense DCB-2]|uniref:Imidazole glycerol phosphate synthase subunit HisH n=3 Tax=root TaxID=1 RepID=HIS5_DESHD|nr:imidazole glycerol phosphate synthase subunit HisH [Desulfitobacterium hafniense]B8FP22.1 RecName: Full=Imidazole glycerol phosphate synthase subunit HisH; AltName: Full=IGP synthase glutaminase subunit; AltName: Full=IGP synthase subunit HisH; AltName: Full=ImGP synthase subunit HisH; Short=IGPS subunit HisH [Desulfitobacterium hafniense DCB-2]ACL19547.1 imidazole glycerol phosphate synthase, glutamine amidotransferase subunit [Desulfitobacterium hafniense DCB-2]MEA5023527.1 imidazole glycer